MTKCNDPKQHAEALVSLVNERRRLEVQYHAFDFAGGLPDGDERLEFLVGFRNAVGEFKSDCEDSYLLKQKIEPLADEIDRLRRLGCSADSEPSWPVQSFAEIVHVANGVGPSFEARLHESDLKGCEAGKRLLSYCQEQQGELPSDGRGSYLVFAWHHGDADELILQCGGSIYRQLQNRNHEHAIRASDDFIFGRDVLSRTASARSRQTEEREQQLQVETERQRIDADEKQRRRDELLSLLSDDERQALQAG